MEETQNQTPFDQEEELMDEDLLADESVDTGVKGGSVSGLTEDSDEVTDDSLATDDQDEELVDSSEYQEYGDENI